LGQVHAYTHTHTSPALPAAGRGVRPLWNTRRADRRVLFLPPRKHRSRSNSPGPVLPTFCSGRDTPQKSCGFSVSRCRRVPGPLLDECECVCMQTRQRLRLCPGSALVNTFVSAAQQGRHVTETSTADNATWAVSTYGQVMARTTQPVTQDRGRRCYSNVEATAGAGCVYGGSARACPVR
jgi:hypothetical protein